MCARPIVSAIVVLIACASADAQVETPEQRFTHVRQASLERGEMRVGPRDARIKFILLTCNAECISANVIEASEVGDICRIIRPAAPVPFSGWERRFTSAFALRQPRRDQIMELARDLLRTKPPNGPVPLQRRLLLAYRGDDGWIELTLDRADLPDAAQSFVHEMAAERYLDFGPWVPHLPFDARFEPDERPSAAVFAASDDGDLLASVQDGQVILLDPQLQPFRSVALPEPVLPPPPRVDLTGRAGFSPNGKWFAVATHKRIVVLDGENWSAAASIPLEDGLGVRTSLFFTRDSESLVVSSRTIRVFQADRWSRLDDVLPAGIKHFCESPRGDRALVLNADGSLRLIDQPRNSKTGEQSALGEGILLAEGCVRCTSAFSPDGSLVAAFTASAPSAENHERETHLRVWRVEDGTYLANLRAFGRPMQTCEALQWLPDGTHLVGLGQPDSVVHKWVRANSIHLWNALERRDVAELVGANRAIGLAVSSSRLFAADRTGQVLTWYLDDLPKRLRSSSDP